MMRDGIPRKPTIDIPPWPAFDEHVSLNSTSGDYLIGEAMMAALQRYLPANDLPETEEVDPTLDAYSCDDFRIYEFKIRRCARGRPHDWTECPFAHPGEKARRRDPRKYHYSGAACPEFRKGSCKRGDSCEFAHGVFECWLHPARYRTQPCKDGTACRRRVCFFAHAAAAPRSARVVRRIADAAEGMMSFSPPMSPPGDSPPMSPIGTSVRRGSWPVGSPVSEALLSSLRKMQLGELNSLTRSWGTISPSSGLVTAPGFYSLPSSPTTTVASRGVLTGHDELEEEAAAAAVERVESGRALRAKMYERLSKDVGPGRSASGVSTGSAPDFGWVSELVK
ncbi:hypothetical protein HPP92_003952 [Vanilla planifolia]|uniref:C3H1-type domain-containing protein n=1 Tax=Vanilla planifolia TaxID=51239 RepID=A0A835S3F1_VANPL|nr:hypothetical protein HPP92_003952 [Vanilla planifolia]